MFVSNTLYTTQVGNIVVIIVSTDCHWDEY